MARRSGPSHNTKPSPRGQSTVSKSKAAGQRSTTKGRKRAAESTEDSGDGSERGNSERDGVVSPRKNRRRKRRNRNAGSTEETAGSLRANGKGKQREEEETERDMEPEEIEDEPDEPEDEVSSCMRAVGDSLTMLNTQDLDEHQTAATPTAVATKKDSTRDLLTIFTTKTRVVFKKPGTGATELLEGRWCMLCK